ITNGATQWMTAGAGILHIERPPEALIASGGLFHGIQLWVNLPAEQKWTPPRYQDIGAALVAPLSPPDGGALVRVLAGEVAGHAGPGVTHTPITLVHATINPGAELRLPWRREFNGLVYVLAGQGTVGLKRAAIGTGQLAAFGTGDVIRITADLTQESRSPNLEVLVLGGEPVGEPVAWYGPFVLNTHDDRRRQRTWRAGRIDALDRAGRPRLDHALDAGSRLGSRRAAGRHHQGQGD